MADVVFLTDPAKEQMEIMLNDLKNAVRLALKGGGCAGSQVRLDIRRFQQKQETKSLIYPNGKFAIDSMSTMYLIGFTVDYKKEVFGSYFDIKPASTSSCGCGESIGF